MKLSELVSKSDYARIMRFSDIYHNAEFKQVRRKQDLVDAIRNGKCLVLNLPKSGQPVIMRADDYFEITKYNYNSKGNDKILEKLLVGDKNTTNSSFMSTHHLFSYGIQFITRGKYYLATPSADTETYLREHVQKMRGSSIKADPTRVNYFTKDIVESVRRRAFVALKARQTELKKQLQEILSSKAKLVLNEDSFLETDSFRAISNMIIEIEQIITKQTSYPISVRDFDNFIAEILKFVLKSFRGARGVKLSEYYYQNEQQIYKALLETEGYLNLKQVCSIRILHFCQNYVGWDGHTPTVSRSEYVYHQLRGNNVDV